MPRTALGEGGGLTRTHSDRPKTTHHPQKSGLADFQVENLQAYELSGLAPNGSINQQSLAAREKGAEGGMRDSDWNRAKEL